MSKSILVCLLISLSSLHASSSLEEEPVTLSAQQVDYQDKIITLAGNVVVNYELGKVAAQNVKIEALLDQGKTQIGLVQLKDTVRITLRDGGHLTCDAVTLDHNKMQGFFSGNVVYSEVYKGKNRENIPLMVKGQKMDVEMVRITNEASPTNFIGQVVVEGDVNVNYNHDFIANADKADYQRIDTKNEQKPAGILVLSMLGENRRCKVVNHNGDLIRADEISIDVLKKELFFKNADGMLYGTKEEGKPDQGIEFSGGILVWDGAKDLLMLKQNAVINQPGFGRLSAEGEVRIAQQLQAGKKRLSFIETEGKTIIIFFEPEKSIEHTLTNQGKVFVDHINLQTTMSSPVDTKGNVSEELQVIFEDPQGEIRANKAFLHYSLEGGKITLSKINLEGNVRLKDWQQENKEVLHYIVADFVEFIPGSKELTFTSKAKKRVLFYDQVNNVQVSAPALKIIRDGVTKKEAIKGIGDVRFSFIDQEYTQLRERFKLDSLGAPR